MGDVWSPDQNTQVEVPIAADARIRGTQVPNQALKLVPNL